MERLTRRIGKTIEFVDGKGYAILSLVEGQKLLFDRLAAYEDSGLTADEIKGMQEEVKRLKQENAQLRAAWDLIAIVAKEKSTNSYSKEEGD